VEVTVKNQVSCFLLRVRHGVFKTVDQGKQLPAHVQDPGQAFVCSLLLLFIFYSSICAYYVIVCLYILLFICSCASTFNLFINLTEEKTLAVCFLDGSGVLYNNFIADSSSSPDNLNTDYSCAVAATSHWEMARCNDKHRVVCQSDYNTLPGSLQANSMSTS